MNRRVDSPWLGVLLCAGLGTRLRPLTDILPKPLLPVGDMPMAQRAARQLVAAGAWKLRINAFHLATQVEAFAQDLASELAIDVACYVENELLGTGGGIAAMTAGPAPLVVWNGDIYAPSLELDWVNDQVIDTPTLVVSPVRTAPGTHAEGTIGINRAGDVVRVRGERFGAESASVDYIGVAVLPAGFTSTLPRVGCLIGDGILPWLRAGARVRAHVFDGDWSDGGTLGGYWRQNLDWLKRAQRCYYVAAGATCEPRIELRDSVIGRGARVLGRGALERTIVLPGARAIAPLSDAIVVSDTQVIRLGAGQT